MVNKHFFKILFSFLGMLILGIVILFLINHFEGKSQEVDTTKVSASGRNLK